MKYCLSVRNVQLRPKADEFMINYKDKDVIYDLIKDYPNTNYILRIPKELEQVDWKEIYDFNAMIPLTVALENIFVRPEGIKFYWAYPISTYYELEAMNNIGASAIILAPPLSFDLKMVRKSFQGQIRMVANEALSISEKQLYSTGLYGGFIRPEDVDLYGQYVDVLEFTTHDLKQEIALYEIYHDKKEWKGNLNLLLENLNINIDNRGIPDDFGKIRLNCQQRCKRNNTCHICDKMFSFTTAIDTHKKEIREMLS